MARRRDLNAGDLSERLKIDPVRRWLRPTCEAVVAPRSS